MNGRIVAVMMTTWAWITLMLTACGPTLEATNARHVLIEIEDGDPCDLPCQRASRPGESLKRCSMQESGWYLNPRFAGEKSPPSPPDVFDMATILGPLVAGFAVCTFAGGSK
jgi:hypothetical protein